MGLEAEAEQEYREDVKRLTEIATQVCHGSPFLKAMADAWLHADSANKRILKPAWSAIVIKYDLWKEAG